MRPTARVCERCGRDWRRLIPSRWCSDCRADLVRVLRAERREQQEQGHDWDTADILRAIDGWADGDR